jgi:hypothetical protein
LFAVLTEFPDVLCLGDYAFAVLFGDRLKALAAIAAGFGIAAERLGDRIVSSTAALFYGE